MSIIPQNLFNNYGVFYLENLDETKITNCTFLNNKNIDNGGVIYAISTSINMAILNISKCLFLNNNVLYNGGAIYGLETIIYITLTIFSNNTATNGGVIYFSKSKGFQIKKNMLIY